MLARLIFLLMLLSCSTNSPSPKHELITNVDSAIVVDSTLATELGNQLTITKEQLAARGINDSIKNNLIDSLQRQLIDSKFDKIKLIIVQDKLKKLNEDNHILFTKLDKLKLENGILKDSTKSLNIHLEIEQQKVKKAKATIKSITDKIKFSIADIQVRALTVTKPLFGKPKTLPTELASKAQYIEIRFLIPANPNLKQMTYVVHVCIYGVGGVKGICKDLLVRYEGEEQKALMTFSDTDEFRAGIHDIKITLNNETLHETSLTLK